MWSSAVLFDSCDGHWRVPCLPSLFDVADLDGQSPQISVWAFILSLQIPWTASGPAESFSGPA